MKTKTSVLVLALLTAVSAAQAQTPAPAAPPAVPATPAAPEPKAEKSARIITIKKHADQPGEKVTFLGVETAPAGAALAAQLNLAKGTGLLVKGIVPESAAVAVLKENDILLKFDDQLLIEPNQLAVLVRNHKDGDEVKLTFLRGGKESTATVKLTQREKPAMKLGMHGFGPDAQPLPGPWGATDPASRAEMDRVLSLIDENGEGRQVRRLQIERAGDGPGMTHVTVVKGNSNLVYSDEQGTLNLTIKDGKKSLDAKNAKGESIFSGPVDTPEQRKALPPEVAERLKKVEAMQNVRFQTDDDFKGRDVKVLAVPATRTSAERVQTSEWTQTSSQSF